MVLCIGIIGDSHHAAAQITIMNLVGFG